MEADVVLDDKFLIGRGNYLKDRGYADPEEARTKFLLANEISVAIERMGVSQRFPEVEHW